MYITVIIATRNAGHLIRRCLESVLRQSFEDVEVIVKDCDSTDHTRDEVHNVIKSYPDRRIIFISQSDSGIYAAWNVALSHASGEWVCFLGADDVFLFYDALEKRVALIAQSPDANLLSGQIILYNESENKCRVFGERWCERRLVRYQNVAHIGLMKRRRLLQSVGGFRPHFRIAGDYDFLLRAKDFIVPIFNPRPDILATAGGLSQKYALRTLFETFKAQSSCHDAGRLCATLNFLPAIAKLGVRRTVSWCRAQRLPLQ